MHLLTVAATTLLTLSFVSATPNFFTGRGTDSNDDTDKESIPVDKCPSLPLWGPSYAPVPGSCTKYYRCAIITGQPIIFECPVPLQFNPITGYCDIFQNVRCKNGKYPTDYEYGDKSKKPVDDNSGYSGDKDKRQDEEENGDTDVDSNDQQIPDGTTNGDGDNQTVIDNTQDSSTQLNDNVKNIKTALQNQSYAITEPTDTSSDTSNTQEDLFSDDFDAISEIHNEDDGEEYPSNNMGRYNLYKRDDIKDRGNEEEEEEEEDTLEDDGYTGGDDASDKISNDKEELSSVDEENYVEDDNDKEEGSDYETGNDYDEEEEDTLEDDGYTGGDGASDKISDDKDELSSVDEENYVEDDNDKEEGSDYETGNDYDEEEIIDGEINSNHDEHQSNNNYKEESSTYETENDYDEQENIGDDEEYSSIDNYNTTKN
ncbi:hypothetical protein BDC45DRAFT_565911 [Circinella umbellata]|nr:hypothetical protein BDC45DRAFT_565911 [Circinella umbellata]